MFGFKKHEFFSNQEEQEIILAIRHAERQTSGEIRVHVQRFLDKDVLADAIKTFHRLKMDRTKDRNAVIFFLIPEEKQFAVYGDEGIHQKVADVFWNDVKDILATAFRDGHYVEGLSEGIKLTGEKLQAFFPYQSNDKNELLDEISYD